VPNQEEIGRITDAVTAIRPEWPTGKVADYLETAHGSTAFDVLAAAAVFVAAQSMAKDLSWLEHDGHWWIKAAGTVPVRRPDEQRISRKRDEAWWANFNMAQSQRQQRFGYPKPVEDADA
jgi:hypothetical protein